MLRYITRITILFAFTSLILTGCSFFDKIKETADTAIKEGTEAAENIQTSVENVQTTVTDKVEKVNTAVESVQNAVTDISAAAESTKKAAEDIQNISK